MIAKIKDLLRKYREQILYLFFGGLTTLIDLSVTFLFYLFLEKGTGIDLLVNAAAWLIAVLFAYATNRKWVFGSRRTGAAILGEFLTFAGGRLATLGLQLALIWLLQDAAGWNRYLVKILVTVVVLILNYVVSKLIVFRGDRK